MNEAMAYITRSASEQWRPTNASSAAAAGGSQARSLGPSQHSDALPKARAGQPAKMPGISKSSKLLGYINHRCVHPACLRLR